MINNYDPNKDYKHIWKIKLQNWKYCGEIKAECGGNCHGFDTLESAISFYLEEHDSVTLKDKEGNTCEVEFFGDEQELKNIVVGAELIRVEKDV